MPVRREDGKINFQFINKRLTDLPADLNFGKMCKHEEKHCQRCQLVFECKPGSVLLCQCNAIQLSVEERAYIEAKYDDCLCIDCLRDLQKKYEHFKTKYIFKE